MLSRLLGLVRHKDQIEDAFQIYDSIRRPRAQAVVQESREVGLAYYLIHPDFGHDLQQITDEANRRLPLIWWYDLEADVKKAEERFKSRITRMRNGNGKSGTLVEIRSIGFANEP